MTEAQEVTIRVLGEDVVEPADLADFLHLFRATHLGLQALGAKADSTEAEIESYREQLNGLSPETLNGLFQRPKGSGDLAIERISHQSPLEIVFVGALAVLALRIAVLGGKIELGGFSVKMKAEVPSLGSALGSLKKALGLEKTINAGFGIRGKTIKLNAAEYAVLMQDVNGEGGFQDFFLRLQHRVHKQTKELRLDDDDLERIYKYKDHPKDGGFQGRINKVFARHFPDSRETKLLLKPK